MARITCPNILCRSHNCTPVAEKKKYGVGKGALVGTVGAVTLGVPGLLAGAASGFNGKKKVKFMCNKCGKIFEVRI